MNKAEYQRYLASREWALLKNKIRERSDGKCERCMVGNYESTHHITYECIGQEKLEDLIAVCGKCHEFLSGKSHYDPSLKSARLADELLTEMQERVAPAMWRIRCILEELGMESFELEIHGLLADISSTVQDKFLPALREHLDYWIDEPEVDFDANKTNK